jgi:hypothetical protein
MLLEQHGGVVSHVHETGTALSLEWASAVKLTVGVASRDGSISPKFLSPPSGEFGSNCRIFGKDLTNGYSRLYHN